jgi:hypothetical protein
MIYRHGDVILKGVEKVGRAVPFDECKNFVLAEGEVTGHMHTLKAGEGGVLAPWRTGRKKSLRLWIVIKDAPAILTHQEHDTLIIEPGTYEILKERTHDYLGDQSDKFAED